MYIDKQRNRWYKGNLHTHTTRSDGVLSPEDTKNKYREMGYDFVALTDHWVYGESDDADSSGLVILSGVEYNFNGQDVVRGVYHVVAIGTEQEPSITRSDDAKTAVATINQCGGVAILAHPAWSLNTCDMIMDFEGLFATEIYNSISGYPCNCRPYSGIVVDQMAARDYVLKLIADDDTHFHIGEEGMSYILVNLGQKELTSANLMQAIKAGDFIATQGPVFTSFREGNEIVVKCDTPAKHVTFFTNLPFEYGRTVIAEGEPLYEARFKLHEGVTFVRAEITDAEGRVGFAQIIQV